MTEATREANRLATVFGGSFLGATSSAGHMDGASAAARPRSRFLQPIGAG